MTTSTHLRTLREALARPVGRAWAAVGASVGVCVSLAGSAEAQTRFQVAAGPTPAPRLSEIVIHEAGLDTHEFVEIQGAPFASLAGHLLVIVDGDAQNAGVVDRVLDLNAYTIPASGYFVAGDSAVFPKDVDLGAFDQLENGTSTYYLVNAPNPALVASLVGSRVVFAPGVTSLAAVSTIVDRVAIADLDFPAADVVFDSALVVGPEGRLTPAGIYRCANAPMGWSASYVDYDANLPAVIPPTPGAANAACDAGVPYCFGDGSGTTCPCGNASTPGDGVGCLSSLGVGGKLRSTGTASLAADTVVLTGTQLPNGPALYFQGTTRMNGGAGIVFGDGLRCVAGSIWRLGTVFSVGATSQYPSGALPPVSVRGFVATPGVRTYQTWYRDSAAFCTSATYNLTNALEIQWVP